MTTRKPVPDDQRYRTMMEAARDAIFLMDSDRFVLFNGATLEMFRCTEEELRDHTPWDFSPEYQAEGRTSREVGMARIRAALDGEPQVFHWIHRRLDGSEFDAEVSLNAIAWDEGLNLLAVVRDLSDRKRFEAELRRSEERFRRIVQDQTDFIVRWLPGGQRTFVNRAYCEFYGVTPEEAARTSFLDLIHPDDRARIRAKIASLTPDKPVASEVHRSIRSDGSTAYTLWTDRAFFDDHGNVVDYQSVGRDITEHRQLEEQLRQSQKLEALGRLAGGLAHDFNNTLAIILGYAELLRDEDEDPTHQDHIRRIITAAERSANINYQLLTFSRKSTFQRTPLSVNEAVQAVVEILEATLPKTIRIETALGDAQAVVEGDGSQIENMVLNLGINAGHAMPAGGTLTIGTRITELDEAAAGAYGDLAPGRYVELCVQDTGVGMAGDVLDHIFEPFFTTKAPGEGTGLGLAAVYGTVQAHDGHIEVQTQPGQGSEFIIFLPASDARVTVDRSTGVVRGDGESILVVEDEKDLRDYLVRTLGRFGYQVRAVQDGTAAIDAFREHHATTDLVMLDLNLPGTDGRRTLLDLRQIDPDVPVLLSTGYTATNMKGLENLPVLQKPYTMAELSRRVREAIDAP